jgi:hypothetical protein
MLAHSLFAAWLERGSGVVAGRRWTVVGSEGGSPNNAQFGFSGLGHAHKWIRSGWGWAQGDAATARVAWAAWHEA